MKKNKAFVFIVFILFFIACDGLNHKHIVGRYSLVSLSKEGQALGYLVKDSSIYVCVVSECVFAIGHNEQYIILKQHPVKFSTPPPNKKITNYYIVLIYSAYTDFPEKGVIGLLTLEQFNNKKNELHIPDSLSFSIVNKDLE